MAVVFTTPVLPVASLEHLRPILSCPEQKSAIQPTTAFDP
jgi:hypothetical protein